MRPAERVEKSGSSGHESAEHAECFADLSAIWSLSPVSQPMRLFLNMTVCTNWQFLRAGKFIAGPYGHGRTLLNTPSQSSLSTAGAGVLQYLPTGYSIDGAHLTQFFREAHSNAAATGSASWLPCVLAYLSTHQMAAHGPLEGH